MVETWGYKFSDTSVLNYQCVVELCKKDTGECEGLTPPICKSNNLIRRNVANNDSWIRRIVAKNDSRIRRSVANNDSKSDISIFRWEIVAATEII